MQVQKDPQKHEIKSEKGSWNVSKMEANFTMTVHVFIPQLCVHPIFFVHAGFFVWRVLSLHT